VQTLSAAAAPAGSRNTPRDDVAALHRLIAFVEARRPELVVLGADDARIAHADVLIRTLRTQLALAQTYLRK
jgi:hypothetical protein